MSSSEEDYGRAPRLHPKPSKGKYHSEQVSKYHQEQPVKYHVDTSSSSTGSSKYHGEQNSKYHNEQTVSKYHDNSKYHTEPKFHAEQSSSKYHVELGGTLSPPEGARYTLGPPSPSTRLHTERFDRYSTLPSHRRFSYAAQDRYLPPPAPAPSDRYIPSERYIPPPAPSNDRYQDRFMSERFYHTASGNPGDPYMRRDLGYHHHYRLPHPPYHNYHQNYHPAYHHRSRGLLYTPHHVLPSPTRAHLRCCPSPSHYVTDDVPPVLAASLTSGQNLKSFSASVNVNIVAGDRASPLLPREYIGTSGGRHVSTPTPPPCDDTEPAEPRLHYPPARRSCSGVLEPASRRTVTDTVVTPSPVAVSCVVSCPTHPPLWRAVGNNTPQQSSTDSSSRTGSQTPGTDSTPVSAQSSTTSSEQPRDVSPSPDDINNAPSEHEPDKKDQSTSTGPVQRPKTVNDANSLPDTFRERALAFWREETSNFFGLRKKFEKRDKDLWQERHKRLLVRQVGELADDVPPPKLHTPPHQSAYPQGRDGYRPRRPDVLPRDAERPSWIDCTGSKKPTVAHMVYSSVSYMLATITRRRPHTPLRARQWSRSFAPSDVPPSTSRLPQQEVFFAGPQGQSASLTQDAAAAAAAAAAASRDVRLQETNNQPRNSGWQRGRDSPGTAGPEVGSSRIDSNFLGRAFDNSNRRQYGMGIAGRFLRRRLLKTSEEEIHLRDQLDDLDDFRPYFTYWLTTAQVIVFILALIAYGFGPPGIDLSRKSGLVLVTSLSLQQVEYLEPANFFIGPRAADLIHIGARYAPCMRNDPMIKKQREKWRERERDTACCIRNDDSGCVQSSQADCSFLHNNLVRGLEGPTKTISTWKKWTAGDAESGGRISGSVCGLDPKFCENPASVKPHEWPDDITKWPICRKTSAVPRRYRQKDRFGKIAVAEHMACEVIGHPCCIGIHGTCSITTREYCDFVNGYFHEEASLCSQVSCMEDICGMLPFYTADAPDQFYRLWTSIFLHAGILHLAVSVWFQLWIMKDVEKMMGPFRLMILFFGSGIAGSAASCMFTPYRAEVGPAGAHLGVLGSLLIQVLNMWHLLQAPHVCALRILGYIFFFLFLGFLPWIDNFAHLFGIVFGVAYTYIIVPFAVMGKYERERKVVYIATSVAFVVGFNLLLVCYFYFHPVEECLLTFCNLFSCIPLTKNFCAEQNINFIKTGDV